MSGARVEGGRRAGGGGGGSAHRTRDQVGARKGGLQDAVGEDVGGFVPGIYV